MSKTKKIIVTILIIILLIILGVAIWAGISVDKVDKEIVTIKSDIKELEVGWGYQLEIDKTIDKNHDIIYESSNNNILTVDENGFIKAISPGEVTITVTVKGNKKVKDSIKLVVKAENRNKMVLSEKSIYVKVGEERKIYIYNLKKNGYALWESDNPSIATVEDGNIKALALGEVNITVTNESKSKEIVKVYVIDEKLADIELDDIHFETNKVSLDVGENVQLDVIYEPREATDKNLVWKSSDDKVVTVDNNGKVTAIGNGNATITATSSNGLVATCEMVSNTNVVPVSSIKLDKDTVEIYVGDTTPIEYTISPKNATSKNVTWESSNKSIAIVENGYIIARKEGRATITARTNNGKEAKVNVDVKKKVIYPYSIELDATNESINIGGTVTLTPIITPSNATDKSLVWTSSDNSVATVNNGVVKGLKEGKVTVTAKTINDKTVSATITVTSTVIPISEISIDKKDVSLDVGETIILKEVIKPSNATSTNVTWESSNTSVVTINNGIIKTVKPGTAIITVRTENGKTATSKITVKKMEDVITIRSKNAVYTGNPLSATVTSKSGSKTNITYYSDSKCNIKTNTNNANNVGEAPKGTGNYYVIVETNGNDLYNPTKSNCTLAITIMKKPLTVTCQNKEYNGESQVIATCDGGNITNANQTNVGSYQINCNGDNNYSDAQTKTCMIHAINISNAIVSGISSTLYTGSPINPNFDVKINGRTLVKGTDYTYNISNNTNVGQATITITGKGNYIGSKEVQFTINPISVTIECNNKVYNGQQQTIATCNGGTMTGANQVNAGSHNVTCTGKGNYTGTVSKYCQISTVSLSSANISGYQSTYQYTGSAIRPTVSVKIMLNGSTRSLISGTDYNVSYGSNSSPGTGTITVIGKGNYAGSKTVSFTITSPPPVSIICQNRSYNGTNSPIATCTGGSVTNANQVNAGSYQIGCNPDSSHSNTSTKTCTISPLSISSATITGHQTSYQYTGSAIRPNVTVKITLNGSTKTLINGTDYNVSYGSNTSPGTGTITVIGKGNYTGSKSVSFTINSPTPVTITCKNRTYDGTNSPIATCTGGSVTNANQVNVGSYQIGCNPDSSHSSTSSKTCTIGPASITSATISGYSSSYQYAGSAIRPNVTVKITFNGTTRTLASGTDYSLSYGSNSSPGTGTITVIGRGNYTGNKTVSFTITSPPPVTITCQNRAYNGTSLPIATCTGGSVTNASQVNAGSYQVGCNPDSSHSSAGTKTCTISPASLSSATISGYPTSYQYTGKPIKPTVSVKITLNGTTRTLTSGTDYSLSYGSNTSPGTGTITVNGIGNYTGSKTVSFTITSPPPATITCQNRAYNGTNSPIATCTGGSVTNANQVNVGSYQVGCNPDSSHSSTSTKTCTISPVNMSSATITGYSSTYTFTGSAIRPNVTVKMTLNGTTKSLIIGTDYSLSYGSNIGPGTGTITVNGKGNYTGSKSVSFRIVEN